MQGKINGVVVALGNKSMMEHVDVDVKGKNARALLKQADELRDQGQTVVLFAQDGKLCALIGVADRIKATTRAALDALTARGVEVVMVTGDNRRTALAVAATLGLSKVEADVLPTGKADVVKSYQTGKRVVAMAGDGINDAPALAASNIGIAMGEVLFSCLKIIIALFYCLFYDLFIVDFVLIIVVYYSQCIVDHQKELVPTSPLNRPD